MSLAGGRFLAVPFHVGQRVDGFPEWPGAAVIAPELSADRAEERLVPLFRELAERVATERPALVYAADCLAPLGVLAGLQRRGASPFIVWLDAHGDFNTWETTPSGYVGGMPLAILVGREGRDLREGIGLRTLEESRIVISDARDVDPQEGVALEASAIRVAAVGEVPGAVPADAPIYVHLDVDVVTPEQMPALRYPAAGGPSLAEVGRLLEALARTGRVVCATIGCTWDPLRSDAAKARAATDELAARLFNTPT